MKREVLKEKWYQFVRWYCKEGFIDVWSGDALSNPNDDSKNGLNINSFEKYFRLNGDGDWIKRSALNRNMFTMILANRETETSESIWNTAINLNNK